MPAYNKHIQDFLQAICNQIRFKSIHKSVINELCDHIEEQKCEYIKQGMKEETATVKALEQMGDPVLVGKQLDKAHQPKTEWSILALAGILVLIGGVVQFFLSSFSEYNTNVFSNFLIYAPIGIVAFIVTYFFDYTLIGQYSKLVYVVLFTVTVAGFLIFNKVNGEYTHVYYAALLFIPAYAGVIYGFRNIGYWGILACGLFYVPAAFVCFIVPRLLNRLILFSIACLIMLTIAIIKGFFKCNKKVCLAIVYIPTAIITTLQFLFIFSNPYRRASLLVMINPKLNSSEAWQLLTVRKLIAVSKPFGKAVLNDNFANMRVEQLLPEWATNFSLTYIIVHLGYVAGIAITTIIFIFIVRMFISVIKQKNRLGLLLSCAACISITGQFILYLLSNTGVMLLCSSTLPFISFGGRGFVTNMILVGIVLSVHRRTNIAIDKQHNNYQDKRLFTLKEGKLIIDFGIKFTRNVD